MVSIQPEAVLWSAGAGPYTGPDADVVLVEPVEDLVGPERGRVGRAPGA